MVEILHNTVAGITHATSEEVARYFQTKYPRMSSADARREANQLLVTISEYQLMCALHNPSVVSPVVSSQIDQELCLEEEYYDQLPEGTPVDFRQVEQGRTLKFVTLIHRIDQTVARGVSGSNLIRVEEHSAGPLLQLLLWLGTCPLTMELVITRVIAENVETLVKLRKRTLLKVQQYHLKLMSCMWVVAALESHLNHQEDPVEIRRLKQELDTLKVKRDRSKHRRETQQQIIDCCEKDLDYVGELGHPATSEGTPSDALTPTTKQETAEASVEASGSTAGMLPLEEDMEVGNVDSPIRTAEDELLDDQEDSQAQKAEGTPGETCKEADSDTTPTGGETPSTGLTAGLSELSVSSPGAQLTPESEDPTTSTPQGSTSDAAPPEVE